MATVEDALRVALDHHLTGRAAEAEVIYRRILDAVPAEESALHLLGLLYAQSGRTDAAVQLIRRSLAANPGAAEPNANLGKLERVRGNVAAAADRFRRALILTPQVPDRASVYAELCQELRRWDAVAGALRLLSALQPDSGAVCARLGIARRYGGDPDGAGALLRRAVRVRPDFAESWHHLGVALSATDDPAALAAVDRALVLEPADVDVWLNRARMMTRLRRRDPASILPSALRAARLRPDRAEAWALVGPLRRDCGDAVAAAAALRRALVAEPGHAAALGDLAGAMRDLGRIDEALSGHDRAVQLAPALPALRWNRGLTRLLAGDFAGGWDDYEERWRTPGFPTPPRDLGRPLWRGGDVVGRTILLHEEQGRGDAIQFARYAPLVARRGARVVLEVGADLVPLMRTLDGIEVVVAAGEPLPPYDLHCPLLSLPRAFATTAHTVPAAVPYLRADPERARAWRERIAGEGPAVGIVWAGNPDFARDRERSPGLAALLPILGVPGVRVFGLQVGLRRADLDRVAMPASFTDLGSELRDFADTAAVVASLDLVVSSCTAVAHLAGALAVPVWVLLSSAPDWRWQRDRDDSPWYPTARLFRQPTPGDWGSVAEVVRQALFAGGASFRAVGAPE